MRNYNREIIEEILDKLPLSKRKVIHNCLVRNFMLTSSWSLGWCDLTVYKEGWLVVISGTRCKFSVFAKDNDGEYEIMRKPHESKLHRLYVDSGSMSYYDFYKFNEFVPGE